MQFLEGVDSRYICVKGSIVTSYMNVSWEDLSPLHTVIPGGTEVF